MKSVVLALSACLAALAVAGPATASKPPKLAPSDRAAINATLDTFVNHAVKRRDAGAAFDVVTTSMRGGMTRKQWSGGSIPVYPYPAAGRRFHQWTIQYRTHDELAIELLLSPRAAQKGKLGQILFHVYLQPRSGRWLIDSFMPGATFAPVGKPAVVQAAGDFTASAPGGSTYNRRSAAKSSGPGQISAVYAIVPFAVLGLILLAFGAWGLFAGLRYRPRGEALPALPLSIQADDQPRPRHRP
jgi:hypothetical protein